MFKHRNKAIVLGIVLLTMSILIVNIPPAKAQFVLASWDYPDEYGQGIYGFTFWENSTGSWVAAPWYNDIGKFYFLQPDYDYTLNWSEGVAMKLRVFSALNSTFTGAIDEADGQNYQRHSVVVSTVDIFVAGKHIVFSQQNFTYYQVLDPTDEMFYYQYDVILNFLPVAGALYTITVTYEIFW